MIRSFRPVRATKQLNRLQLWAPLVQRRRSPVFSGIAALLQPVRGRCRFWCRGRRPATRRWNGESAPTTRNRKAGPSNACTRLVFHGYLKPKCISLTLSKPRSCSSRGGGHVRAIHSYTRPTGAGAGRPCRRQLLPRTPCVELRRSEGGRPLTAQDAKTIEKAAHRLNLISLNQNLRVHCNRIDRGAFGRSEPAHCSPIL
jgi:hypothetical protein